MKITRKTIATILFVLISETNAFCSNVGLGTGPRKVPTARSFIDERRETSFLLEGFTTYTGEVVQPYDMLGVGRDAKHIDIRRAYIEKSKLYHPDAVRHSATLPSNCISVDDVREQWERIKLSYEILSNRTTRLRYDRNIALAQVLEDPSAVVARAARQVVKAGASNLRRGIFGVGTFAFEQLLKKDKS